MFKLAIIDDEPLIPIGINSLIQYQKLNLSYCGHANTGTDGLALILEQQPDIVILDIAMPNMDGLSVIEAVRERLELPPLFLVLTNHNEFGYIQKALRLGVFDFIIKIEISGEYLHEILQKAVAHLEQTGRHSSTGSPPEPRSEALTEKFLYRVLSDWYHPDEELGAVAHHMNLGERYRRGRVVFFSLAFPARGEQNQISTALYIADLIHDSLKKHLACHTMLWETGGVVTVLDLDQSPVTGEELQRLLGHACDMVKRYVNIDSVYSMGPVFREYRQMPASLRDCLEQSHGSAEAQREFSQPAPQSSFHLCEFRERLAQAFLNADADSLSRLFGEIVHRHMPPSLPLNEALSICFSLLHYTSITIANSQLLFTQYDPMEELRAITGSAQAVDWLRSLEARILVYFEKIGAANANHTVERIIRHIYGHPCDDLTLQDVAERFGLSPQYISNIFSKDSAASFTEHVRLSKMRYAKKMLTEGKAKIHEVSQALGYSDPYYFSKVFKKSEGQSPREFLLANAQK